jgi:hypothetical protein
MKTINLASYTDDQIIFFIEKFKENGWKQEDLQYVNKETDIQDWPLGIVFYPELLEYTEDGKDMITPWICGEVEIETTDDLKLKVYKNFILKELEDMDLNPFHDEDAFYGYFAKNTHKGWTELKFYINKFYPDGYWQNHIL